MAEDTQMKELTEKFGQLHKIWTEHRDEVGKWQKDAGVWKEKANHLSEELGDQKEKTEKLQAALDRVELKLEEIRKVRKLQLPEDDEGKSELEKQAMFSFLRKGSAGLTPEEKAMSVDSGPDGGYMVPDTVSTTIIRKLLEMDPVRSLATVETISQGEAWTGPAEGSQNFTCEWVAERESRNETQTGQLKQIRIPVNYLSAKPYVTQQLIDDAAWDVEGWINERVARRFAIKEGAAFISGDADGKPQGLLTHADVGEVVSGHASELTADGVINLFYELEEPYATNGTFLFRRSTLREIRKMDDGTGNFLWQPGLADSAPPNILGAPYMAAPSVPAIASNAYPIIFGDIRAAYMIVDRMGMTLVRDPYTQDPYVVLKFTMRVGGQVVLAEALKKQKVSA